MVLDCYCCTPEHKIVVSNYQYLDESDLTIYVQLHQYHSFWARLKLAIKYLFNKSNPYGHWDTTLLNKDKALELKNFLDDFIKEK